MVTELNGIPWGLLLFGGLIVLLLYLLPSRRNVLVVELPPESSFSRSGLGCLPTLLFGLLLLLLLGLALN